jgi:hypothetical protein
LNQSKLWATAEEAQELAEAMRELFLSHADRITDPDRRPPGARLVSVVGWVVPSGPLENRHVAAADQATGPTTGAGEQR